MTALSSTLTAENGQMPVLSRRNFLGGSIAFAPLLAAKKLKVVVTGGHPGDPEYGCGGTVAKYTDLGHEVTLLYLNRGEKGCPGETAKACGTKRVTEAQ